jgi:hypothetical protein
MLMNLENVKTASFRAENWRFWKMLIILIPYKSGAYYDTYLLGVAYPFSFLPCLKGY